MAEIKNAQIRSTMLGVEDHGIFSCILSLDYAGSGQGFGGYALDEYEPQRKARFGTAYGMEFIKRILDTLEVDKWEALKGQHIRADADHGKVYGIGHIIKDKWFYPEKDLKDFIK